ncbi:putative polysaccharide biosynthesis protein [Cellulosilyticum ruminicola]|uniref:putative polysaccharide biosynthesis protein n=1 Tax=Cellulosilyticum ruminicola TaxID=425254 RepID=UPI0006D00F3E|nr:polysaccharide biosynthesis protein [Cellulosilyticum ruminicola]
MEGTNNKQGLMKGAMILSMGVLASRIIGMLYRIPIRNILGDDGNSLYGVAYTVYAMILTLTAIAIPGALSKLIAERKAAGAHREAQRVFHIALIYCLAGAFVLALGMWFGADWIQAKFFPSQTGVVLPIRALAPTVMIATTLAVMRGYFQGNEDMSPTAISQVVEQIVNVIFSVLFASILIKTSVVYGATGSALGTGTGAVAGFIVLMLLYKKKRPVIKSEIAQSVEYKYESTGTILKQILGMMIPVIISTSIFSIMTFIDQSMISTYLPNVVDFLKANGQIGLVPVAGADTMETAKVVRELSGQMSYQYGTFMNIPASLVMQLGLAAVPAVAAAASIKDYKEIRKKTKLILKVGMLLAAPCAIGFMLYAKPIFLLLHGDMAGSEVLIQGAIGIFVISLAQLTAGILQGMSLQRIPTINAIVACGIKVLINIAFLQIPVLNIFGFIHSTTICYLIYAILNIYYLCKQLNMRLSWNKLLVKPTISAVLMGALSYPIYFGLTKLMGARFAIIIVMPLAAIIYFFVGILTKTITKSDLAMLPGGRKIIRLFEKNNL